MLDRLKYIVYIECNIDNIHWALYKIVQCLSLADSDYVKNNKLLDVFYGFAKLEVSGNGI